MTLKGSSVVFLGSNFTRIGDAIKFRSNDKYLEEEFTDFGLGKCRVASTPGTHAVKRPIDGCNLLCEDQDRKCRRVVGRLQWIAPVRPDLCYAVKELARALAAPTIEYLFGVKHVLRYVKGTWDLCLTIRSMMSLSNNDSTIEIICECDSDWAGCQSTRKSTSGFIMYLLGAVAHFSFKTQAVPALSSGEAVLYAMGSAAAEFLRVRNYLPEGRLCKGVRIYLNTDSSAATSIASRDGVSKKTKHIELMYLYLLHLLNAGLININKIPV